MAKDVVVLETNELCARMSIYMLPQPGRPNGSIAYIYGSHYVTIDFPVINLTFLPKIDIPAIFRAMTVGGAKHATFSSQGNQFSRIAHLVRAGYAALNSGSQPQSGVRFRWNETDLIRYAQKWKAAENALGDAEAEEAFRFVKHHKRMVSSFYFFKSDTEVQKRRGADVFDEMRAAEEEKMSRGMINI